ncbi:MAG: acyl-phosphate glycerol 3-phosphate acyltransferase [Candidatus Melainabacteria bacterium RIFCSPHIGHO2_02_FULL_34_12]|nr:MAG: acyl-phosphate glycerol 3-phosphate acyltransferase [Candidatus Melainabacteria bacterium RIFCSPHIGHO2_02_FULL_34_12]
MEANNFLYFLIWIILGYLFGSIPTGYWIGKLKGIDLTEIGSGSTGATNVLRNLGKWPAFFTLVIDASKGFLPVFLSLKFTSSHLLPILVALACVIGHSKSVFLNFKGGKSSAVGLGVLMALNFNAAIITFIIWFIIVSISRYSSLGSIIAVPLVPLWFYIFHKPPLYIIFGILIAIYIVLIRHRENIKRLLNGTEPKIG